MTRWHRDHDLRTCSINKVVAPIHFHAAGAQGLQCRKHLPSAPSQQEMLADPVQNARGRDARMKTHQKQHEKELILYFSGALHENPRKRGAHLHQRARGEAVKGPAGPGGVSASKA